MDRSFFQRVRAWLVLTLVLAATAAVAVGLGVASAQTGPDESEEPPPAETGGSGGGAGEAPADEPSDEVGGGGTDTVDGLGGVDLSLETRLESARVQRVDLDDDEDEFVIFTFSDVVQEIDEGGFALAGFDSDTIVESISAEIVEDDPDSVLVGFEEGTDVRSFSIALVEEGTVETFAGKSNVQDTVQLRGSDVADEGRTTGPELVDVSIEETQNQINFEFDEALDEEGSADASSFVFFTDDGELHEGDEVVSVEDEIVVIEYDEGDGDQVDEAAKIAVSDGAIADRQGTENVPGSLVTSIADGRTTAAPGLLSVSRVSGSDTQFDFLFNEDVQNVDPSRFLLFTEDAERFEGSTWSAEEADRIRVTFPDVEDFPGQITMAAVDLDAVEAFSDEGTSNTITAVDVGSSRALRGGRTSGPDLVRVRINEETGDVRYVFDEPIDDDGDYEASAFLLLSETGTVVEGSEIIEVGDQGERFIVVHFGRTVADAADAGAVELGAVQDFQGNDSPPRTILASGS